MESWPEEKYSIMWQPRTSCVPRKKHENRPNTQVRFRWTHLQQIPGRCTVAGKTNPFVCSAVASDHPSIWMIRLCTEIVFWYGSCWQNSFWAEMKQILSKSPPTWRSEPGRPWPSADSLMWWVGALGQLQHAGQCPAWKEMMRRLESKWRKGRELLPIAGLTKQNDVKRDPERTSGTVAERCLQSRTDSKSKS